MSWHYVLLKSHSHCTAIGHSCQIPAGSSKACPANLEWSLCNRSATPDLRQSHSQSKLSCNQLESLPSGLWLTKAGKSQLSFLQHSIPLRSCPVTTMTIPRCPSLPANTWLICGSPDLSRPQMCACRSTGAQYYSRSAYRSCPKAATKGARRTWTCDISGE